MENITIDKNIFVYLTPVSILGVNVDGRANFMALAWFSRVNSHPPLVAVAVHQDRYSYQGLRENRTFSINYSNVEMVEATDYCGLVSGKEVDKAQMFEIFYGELETAPIIKSSPLSFECKLVYEMAFQTHTLFIGEIVSSYVPKQYLSNGQPDLQKMNLLCD